MGQKNDNRGSDLLATACLVFVLIGAAYNRLSMPKPSDATAYHADVKAAAAAIPLRMGGWIAEDVAVPTEAIDQLKPNVIISRRIRNVDTGETASFLLVQCRDVRDLAPHYPPICYPGQGLTLTAQQPLNLHFGGLEAKATRYTFESNNYQRPGVLSVDNFMLLPDGTFRPDMAGMERRIGSAERYFGAAQIQILHNDHLSEAQATAISETMLRDYKPLIDAIGRGMRK